MATSAHPLAALRRVRSRPGLSALERADLEVVCAASVAVVLAAGVTVAGLVVATPLGARAAGVATALLVAAVLSSSAARSGWQRVRTAHLQKVAEARTVRDLDALDRQRWQVQRTVPLGEGRTATVVADGDEVHVLVVRWIPTRRAALHLRCAVAAATAAAEAFGPTHRCEQNPDGGPRAGAVPTVVAWGPGARAARSRQAPIAPQARVLLPGELWAWRIERTAAADPAERATGS